LKKKLLKLIIRLLSTFFLNNANRRSRGFLTLADIFLFETRVLRDYRRC